MNDFFLNQGKSFKAWAPHLYPNFPWELPPGLKFGRLPVTGPLYNSKLPLTQSNFQFSSDHFQYNFTLENSNSRCLKLFAISRRFELSGVDCTHRLACVAGNNHPSCVSLARARSLFCPLLPSACYADCTQTVNLTYACLFVLNLLAESGYASFTVVSKHSSVTWKRWRFSKKKICQWTEKF